MNDFCETRAEIDAQFNKGFDAKLSEFKQKMHEASKLISNNFLENAKKTVIANARKRTAVHENKGEQMKYENGDLIEINTTNDNWVKAVYIGKDPNNKCVIIRYSSNNEYDELLHESIRPASTICEEARMCADFSTTEPMLKELKSELKDKDEQLKFQALHMAELKERIKEFRNNEYKKTY